MTAAICRIINAMLAIRGGRHRLSFLFQSKEANQPVICLFALEPMSLTA